MSLIIAQNTYSQIPQSILLNPSLTRLEKVKIPIAVFIKGLENTFNCKINFLTNRSQIFEIKTFMLGDIHFSRLHQTINTLIVMLFGKNGDKVSLESSERELEYTRPMIEKRHLTTRLHYDTWDPIQSMNQKDFESICTCMDVLGRMAQGLVDIVRDKQPTASAFIKELTYWDMELIRAELLENETFKKEYIENRSALVDEFLIKKIEEDRDQIATDLFEIVECMQLTLKRLKKYIQGTFSKRQEGLVKHILNSFQSKLKTFYLAGEDHLTAPDFTFERSLQETMLTASIGYLALSISTGRTFENEHEQFENEYEQAVDSIPNFNWKNDIFGMPIAHLTLFFEDLRMQLFDIAEEMEESSFDGYFKPNLHP